MSQPAVAGGYVPQPGSPNVQNPSSQHYQQQQLYYVSPASTTPPAAAQFTVSRCALKVLTCVSILLSTMGGTFLVIGIPMAVRRFTLGEIDVEYYLYEVDVNGISYTLEDSIRIPYAIAMAFAATGAASVCFSLPFGIHEMKSLFTTTTQPYRGPIRFARSSILFVAASLGFASLIFVVAARSNDYSDAGPNVINTFNSSTLCEGFILLLIGSLVLGLSDVLCICHAIFGGRLDQVDVNNEQQSLIQQNHYPQQHYHQQQQQQQQYQPAQYPPPINVHPGTTTLTAPPKA